MRRRTLLATAGAAGLGLTAGCAGSLGGVFETTNSREPAVVTDRPDAVYLPTHREGMAAVGRGRAGDLTVVLGYSYPHRFWVIEPEDGGFVAERVEIGRDDAVHLMATPVHEPTGTVVPGTGLSVEVTRDGSLVTQETIYPMLSQRMGFHYGANVPLDGDGRYEVTVSVGGASLARYGAFEGLFDAAARTTVPFEYREAERNEIPYERLGDRAGERGAVAPASMESLPVGRAPDPLPGGRIGAGTVADARLVGTALAADRFGDGTYVAVSARTPHNRLVIPGMALSLTTTGGATTADGRLSPALDPDLGFHYGTLVDGPIETAALSVDVAPQVARHEGYETAFLATGETALD